MKKFALIALVLTGCAMDEATESTETAELGLSTFMYTQSDGGKPEITALDDAGTAQTNDVFQEFCTHNNSYEICVTYNFTSRTAAANVQNEAGSARSTTIRLRRTAINGPVLASTSLSLGAGAWRGVFKSGVATDIYCSEAQNGSTIVGICHNYR